MAPADVCSIASNFQANNIAESSANISWLGDSTNNSYEMQYRVLGTDEWTSFNTTVSFALLNGLNYCSTYDWYIVNACNNGALSNDSNITSFTSMCKNIVDENSTLIDEDFNVSVYPVPLQDNLFVEFNLVESSAVAEV